MINHHLLITQLQKSPIFLLIFFDGFLILFPSAFLQGSLYIGSVPNEME